MATVHISVPDDGKAAGLMMKAVREAALQKRRAAADREAVPRSYNVRLLCDRG